MNAIQNFFVMASPNCGGIRGLRGLEGDVNENPQSQYFGCMTSIPVPGGIDK